MAGSNSKRIALKTVVVDSTLTVTDASLSFDCAMASAPTATSAASQAGSIALVAVLYNNLACFTIRHRSSPPCVSFRLIGERYQVRRPIGQCYGNGIVATFLFELPSIVDRLFQR
jgi:hypothetical protein